MSVLDVTTTTGSWSGEGWKDRIDSIISRSTFLISSCDRCSDFDDSSDSDAISLKSVDSMAEFDYEDDDASSPYYSLGESSALTEAWSERAAFSLASFSETMGTLIDRVIALSPTAATVTLKLNIGLICSECDAYLRWTETEHEPLKITGLTDKVTAVIVEDMTADMVELFEDLTSFHPYYNAEYNAGRFNGYLTVLTERLEKLEADQLGADVAAAKAYLELADK
ncbi:unnamed protein product [Aureobasidium mustum]|uniref:Uncharacterized protein n=1 Tax=Aureobasidium mustum TaxID=2773714 RepID=A0A9N8JRS0_9PEZI|nr:unnamed protein product [Aureobasidium mustum]